MANHRDASKRLPHRKSACPHVRSAAAVACRSERLLEVKTGEATPRLLGRHHLGHFRAGLAKSALSIEFDGGLLNLGRAQNHFRESERARLVLQRNRACVARYPTRGSPDRDTCDAVPYRWHCGFQCRNEPTMSLVLSTTQKALRLASEKTSDKLLQLTLDRRRDVLLHELLHPDRRQFPIDARPQRGDRFIVRKPVGRKVTKSDVSVIARSPMLRDPDCTIRVKFSAPGMNPASPSSGPIRPQKLTITASGANPIPVCSKS